MNATVVVERVIKGTVTQGVTIPLSWSNLFMPVPPTGGTARPLTGYGIFFLQRNPSGSWTVLPTTNGAALWDGVYKHIPQTAPQSVRNIVLADVPNNASPLDKVVAEMLIAVESGGPLLSEQLMTIFRETKSPVISAAFRRFLSKPDLNSLCVGLRGELATGDASVVSTMRQRYKELSSAKTWPGLIDELKLYYVNTTPQVVNMIGEITTDISGDLDLRTAAAVALARIHTKECLPYLAKMLGNANTTFRSMAVRGFSMFANNVPIGSWQPAAGPWPYRTDETIAHAPFSEANVSFWHTWWQKNESVIRNFQ